MVGLPSSAQWAQRGHSSAQWAQRGHSGRRSPAALPPIYYSTILLYTYLLFYCSTILLLYCSTILLFYYFTILLFYYSTILLYTYLLFYYSTFLLFYYTTSMPSQVYDTVLSLLRHRDSIYYTTHLPCPHILCHSKSINSSTIPFQVLPTIPPKKHVIPLRC